MRSARALQSRRSAGKLRLLLQMNLYIQNLGREVLVTHFSFSFRTVLASNLNVTWCQRAAWLLYTFL